MVSLVQTKLRSSHYSILEICYHHKRGSSPKKRFGNPGHSRTAIIFKCPDIYSCIQIHGDKLSQKCPKTSWAAALSKASDNYRNSIITLKKVRERLMIVHQNDEYPMRHNSDEESQESEGSESEGSKPVDPKGKRSKHKSS